MQIRTLKTHFFAQSRALNICSSRSRGPRVLDLRSRLCEAPTCSEMDWELCLPYYSAFLWLWQSSSPAHNLWQAVSFWTRLFGHVSSFPNHDFPQLSAQGMALHTSSPIPFLSTHVSKGNWDSNQGHPVCTSQPGRAVIGETSLHHAFVFDPPYRRHRCRGPRWAVLSIYQTLWDVPRGTMVHYWVSLCVEYFHSISIVTPQQLSRPTVQHGSRSSFPVCSLVQTYTTPWQHARSWAK